MDHRVRALVSLAVIAVAAAATAGAWRLRPPPPPPPGAANEPLFDFDPSKVRSIDLEGWQGSLRARRVDGTWRVEEAQKRRRDGAEEGPVAAAPTPSAAEADQVVAALVRELIEMPVVDRFPRDGRPLAEYGLEKPQLVIALGLDDGTTRRIEVGELTITRSALYARAAPPDDVIEVGTLLFSAVDGALYRLRGPRALLPAPTGGSADAEPPPVDLPDGGREA